MSPYESLIAAIVLVYALNFLIFPHPALKTPPTGPEKPVAGRPALDEEREPVDVPAPFEAPASRDVLEAKPDRQLETESHAELPGPSLVERLRLGLSKTRTQLFKSLDELFISKEQKIRREELLELLFETLIRCDVGVATTEKLVKAVQEKLMGESLSDPEAMKATLSAEMESLLLSVLGVTKSQHIAALLEQREAPVRLATPSKEPHVVMIVGVNGVGKTTTTGKIAKALRDKGHPVVLGAADTFRAAAVEQLRIWSERAGAEFVTVKEGSDPAAVAFEAVKKATDLQQKVEEQVVCLVDTAGRLHNRKDLMEELSKVRRVMGKNSSGAPHEVLLIVDATTGQNAIMQARTFREAVDIDGLVLTKLDGTAKGGVALAIAGDLGLPIRFVGVGEGVEDLQPFNATLFVQALVGTPEHGTRV